MKSGQQLPDTILNYMNLTYYQNGVRNYMRDFARASEQGYSLGVQTSLEIGIMSANQNIKTYYVEYQTGERDTLFVDYRHVSADEAFNNSCFCYYPIQAIRFNGKTANLDSSITNQSVYLFSK